MPTQHSPKHKDDQPNNAIETSPSTSDPPQLLLPVTMDFMYTEMMSKFKQTMDKFDQTNTNNLAIQTTQNSILERLDKMEKEKDELTKNNVELAQSVNSMKEVSHVSQGLHDVHDRITEEISRVRRM